MAYIFVIPNCGG